MASADDRAHPRSQTAARLARAARHDLRGALNALHLHVELLVGAESDDGGAAATRHRRAEHAAVVREACRSLCELLPLVVHPLPPSQHAGDAALAALVSDVVALVGPIASARGVDLDSVGPDRTHVLGEGAATERTREALVDLLLDALKVAPRGCTLRLVVDQDGRRARVTSPANVVVEIVLQPGDS